jgi:hypothetical protein
VIFLLTGCGAIDWCARFNLDCAIDPVREEIVDSDSDVWPDTMDCSPANSAVFPYATESCDGVDNNCDGEIDEGVSTTYYLDSDGDGFPIESAILRVCLGLPGPAGWIAQPEGWDCDDTDADTFPGAPESCDEADNDCDGETDEGALATFYLDADGDTYGDPDLDVEGCFAESGYTRDDTDCDDADGGIYPGAPETCDDIDADCDGRLVDCVSDLPDARWWSGQEDELAGWSVGGAGDVDGDGLADILIGAQGWISPDGATNTGAAYLITGATSGALSDSAIRIHGASGSDFTGYSVGGVGDLDSDGFDDILIGASNGGEDGEGMAWLVMGPITASAGIDTIGIALLGGEEGSYTGVSIAGIDDRVLISAPYSDTGGQDAGLVYLTQPGSEDAVLPDISEVFTGTERSLAGWSTDSAGDTDGDGLPEIIVGAPNHDSGAGVAWLVDGGPGGDLSTLARRTFIGSKGDYAGAAVAGVGDVDGDGLADIAVGAYGESGGGSSAGAVFVIPGSSTASGTLSLSSTPTRLIGAEGDYAGYAVEGAGDVDGDGLSDILVGAQRADGDGGDDGGVTWLISAPGMGTLRLAAVTRGLSGPAGDRTGWSVAGIGDADGDGLSDILIGAPYSDAGASDGGAAWLVFSADL